MLGRAAFGGLGGRVVDVAEQNRLVTLGSLVTGQVRDLEGQLLHGGQDPCLLVGDT